MGHYYIGAVLLKAHQAFVLFAFEAKRRAARDPGRIRAPSASS